jgi:site-specific recombinase XerD
MPDHASLGPWVRRFLLEYLVTERNLSINTQKSYRDMLTLLLPYVAGRLAKPVDRLAVVDLTPAVVREFLLHLETDRHCSPATRNQRLASSRRTSPASIVLPNPTSSAISRLTRGSRSALRNGRSW